MWCAFCSAGRAEAGEAHGGWRQQHRLEVQALVQEVGRISSTKVMSPYKQFQSLSCEGLGTHLCQRREGRIAKLLFKINIFYLNI